MPALPYTRGVLVKDHLERVKVPGIGATSFTAQGQQLLLRRLSFFCSITIESEGLGNIRQIICCGNIAGVGAWVGRLPFALFFW
jgi:hypothetical protein